MVPYCCLGQSVRLSHFVCPLGTNIFHKQGVTNIFALMGGKYFYIEGGGAEVEKVKSVSGNVRIGPKTFCENEGVRHKKVAFFVQR